MADRRAAGFKVVLASLLLLAGAGSARAAERLLHGVARDSLGRVLEDVEIYVLQERGGLPVASALTRADGRYVIEGVPAGIYRIAGIKAGYLAVFGRVNTSLRTTLDLLLDPAPRPGEPGGEQDPGRPTWALRLPARSVFRDVAPAAVSGAPERSTPFRAAVEGQVDQLFALGRVGSGAREGSGIQGTETRLRLGGSLGERGNVRLRGRHETLDASKAADLLVDLRYDPTSDTKLNVRSYYGRADLLAAQGSVPSPQPRTERAWGCEARWAKQINTRSRLDVGVHYLDSLVESPARALSPPAPLSHRSVGTRGTFESVVEGGHQLQFDFHAHGQLQSERLEPTLAGTSYPQAPSVAGWNLGFDARDAWLISTRAALLYGLGYYQPLDLRGSAPMTVPRVGGLWSGEHLLLRGVVSYHDAGTGDARLDAGASPLGWEAQAQVGLPYGVVARGDVSFTPVQAHEAAQRSDFDAPPLYVTSGAASRRTAFAFERTAGGTTTSLELARGVADGMISVLEDDPIRFETGKLGVRIAPTGTEVAAEYRRGVEMGPGGERASNRRSVELRLAQDLARRQGNGSYWKLLLMARGTSGDEDPRDPGEWTDLATTGRELSAGISVAF